MSGLIWYSKLKGGSPHLCRLRPALIGSEWISIWNVLTHTEHVESLNRVASCAVELDDTLPPYGCYTGQCRATHGVSAEAYAWKATLGWGRTRPDSLTTSWTVATHGALQACVCHVVWFIPLQGWLLIQISTIPSDMGDGLFAAPKRSNSTFIMLLGSWDGYRLLGSRRDD
jgi:hypothetical protein